MIAFRQIEPELFFGIRIEVHESRRLRLDGLGRQQRAVHPESELHRRASTPSTSRTFAGQTEAHDVLAGELNAVLRFDRAAIGPADSLLAREIADLQRLGGKVISRQRPTRDALGRRQVALHQQRRHRQHVADVVEPSAESSTGKSRSARNRMPRRSRMVLVYSFRFRRCAVMRPGSG